MNVELPEKLECLRCGWKWIPRQAEVRICPACKSYLFDKPRKEKKNDHENVHGATEGPPLAKKAAKNNEAG